MQNKGFIKFFAVAFALVCIYQLSFTWVTYRIDNKANEFAQGDPARKIHYQDSIATKEVYNFLWLKKFTYRECKEREINLGLDLKGGMNVTMEVSVVDVIKAMSNYSKDTTFTGAIDLALRMEKTSQKDYVTLFGEAFTKIDPNAKLAAIFNTVELKDKINYNSSNEEVLKVIRAETEGAIDNTFNILRTRIDRFGVAQPNIQKMQTSGRILIELPGIKEPERVRKLLQGTANLEFWETYDNQEVFQYIQQANGKVKEINDAKNVLNANNSADKSVDKNQKAQKPAENRPNQVVTKDTVNSLIQEMAADSIKSDSLSQSAEQFAKNNPVFAVLQPRVNPNDGKLMQGAAVGYSHSKDTALVNRYLGLKQVKALFPRDLKFLWSVKAIDQLGTIFELVAIKINSRDGRPALDGEAITEARAEFGNNKSTAEVTMAMTGEGAKIWARLTKENIGRQVAIVLDNYVYSYPVVQTEITGGRSSITGNFSVAEAKDLANILKSGKLPAPAKIVEEAVVGPTLGQEAINAGLWSFIVAFILTLLYMIFYYHTAGLVANVALFVNMFFVFGILASLNAVLTLPGIAGIVLTLGMDVDKNVIIYERIREEIRAGKGMRQAVSDGYKHALTAIIDSNVTTLLTGIVLYVFGSGPVQGFATTLIIGILSSLFCAIFITKLLFIWMLDKKMEITLWTKWTKNILTHTNIDFIKLRITFYIISGALVVIGVGSLVTRGLSYGIDFQGGRTYVVRFDSDIRTDAIRVALGKVYGHEPEVKTFGGANQIKITTSYMIDNQSIETDSIVENKLFAGLKPFYKSEISVNEFLSHTDKKEVGRLSSQKVQPTIAYTLLIKAYWAVFMSLIIIFIYIAFRFRKWQWGLGGVVSLFHDTFIVIAIFSLFSGILPFSLDIDQHFIAAILTIIGYSIMDSVIIFDRIREYTMLYPKRTVKDNMNAAINSTLSRTLNTSGITFMVLLAMFLFGGEVIRGFCFALMIGVAVGTYSSILNATPIAYDLIMWQQRRAEKRAAEKK